MTDPSTPRVVTLTPRQRQVVGEIARDGAVNAVIAERLGCSIDTVKSHANAAMQRVGVTNRAALVCALLRRQVVIRVTDSRGQHTAARNHNRERNDRG